MQIAEAMEYPRCQELGKQTNNLGADQGFLNVRER